MNSRADGGARSTLGDVAALAGVSAKTASRVLNDQANVSEQTRQKVMAAARKLRFQPNRMARELRTGAVTAGLGLVIADLGNPFFSQMAAAAELVGRAAGLDLLIASTSEEPEREVQVVRSMLGRRVRALLVVPASPDHSYLQHEIALGTPIVFVDRPPRNLTADCVLFDNRAAARAGTERLIAAGHERIAVVGDVQAAWTARERLEGAAEALAAAGLSTQRYVRTGAHDPQGAHRAMADLLSDPQPPTAVFALNNLIAVGVLKALRDHRAPCAVLGFDDSEVLDLMGVSVVTAGPRELGRRAAELAVARIGGEAGDFSTLTLPTVFVERTSLALPVPTGAAGEAMAAGAAATEPEPAEPVAAGAVS